MIPLNNFELTIFVILIVIGFIVAKTNANKFIILSRLIVILTSIVCFILSLYSEEMEIVRNNVVLSYMSMYSFIAAIFLYLIPIYLFIFDIYFFF